MRVGAPLPGYAKLAAALAVGLVTTGGPSLASAATRAARDGAGCRAVCYGFYSRMLGSQVTMSVSEPGTVPGAQAGRSVILRQRAARGPAGDFTFSLVARVADFCGTDPADFFASGSYLCAHDFAFEVFEVEWVPYGDESGLCAGVAAGGQVGESVTLRPCGVSVRTLWIASKAHANGRP
jgi:hypothetical protein